MDTDLEYKVAIVTGGAAGIGRASCLALAKKSAAVAVVDIQIDQTEQIAAEIEARGGKAIAIQADVSQELEVENAVQQTKSAFGAIDILVNNAAVEILTPMLSVKVEDWDKVLNTNLRGAFLFTRAVLPELVAQGGGSIVNIGSIDGMRGRAFGAAYAASKAALIAFTESLADELAKFYIRANIICPAGVNTAMWQVTHSKVDPLSVLQPEDVAEMVVFFASDRSRSINGATIEVLGPRLKEGTYL